MQPEEIDKLLEKYNLGFWKGKRDCHAELDKLYKEDLITYIIEKSSVKSEGGGR